MKHFSATQGRVPKEPRRGGGVGGRMCWLRAELSCRSGHSNSPLLKNARGLHTPLQRPLVRNSAYPLTCGVEGRGPPPEPQGRSAKTAGQASPDERLLGELSEGSYLGASLFRSLGMKYLRSETQSSSRYANPLAAQLAHPV